MKHLKLLYLVAAALCLVCGCTGCDSNPSSEDVTFDRSFIASSRWSAQEAYVLDMKTWGMLSITALDDSGNFFKVSVYRDSESSRAIQTATIEYTDDTVVLEAYIDHNDVVMNVKVSKGPDEALVLSLTDEDGEKMFFSPCET